MFPDRVVHSQADKSAEEHVVVDLLDQLALRADEEKHTQQQRPKHIPGFDRGRPEAEYRLSNSALRYFKTTSASAPNFA